MGTKDIVDTDIEMAKAIPSKIGAEIEVMV